ncbi:MAG: DUF4435 domain-containing protein [Treponema sp.]|nr:DUF4435 domain-containing protein [Treponema sp.]
MNKDMLIEKDFEKLNYIQENFSTARLSSVIDWGLLVEGPTDVVFYKKVTDKLTTFHGAPESYEGESSVIPIIIAEKRKNGQHFYGIIDADYKNHKFSDEIKNYMQVTDANSLETMMIKYYGIADFEQLIRKIVKVNYPGNKYNLKEKLLDSIVEMSVKWAYTIGVLRNFNETQKCLSINKLKGKSNYYFDFLNLQKLSDTQVEISFDLEKYLKELIKTNKDRLTLEDLKKEIAKKTFSEEEAYILCQGHDIVDFIEAVMKIYGASIAKDRKDSDKIINNRRGPLDKVSKMEYNILDMYDISRFEKAPLYQWLETIDNMYQKRINQENLKNAKYTKI